MGKKTKQRDETAKLKESAALARASEGQMYAIIQKKLKAGPRKDFASDCDAVLARYAEKITDGCAFDRGPKATNLFQLVGANKLGRANILSRVVSTQLGAAWEEIAALSPRAVNPEHDLGIKITGIDLVFLENSSLVFTQIKTQKNTLTGSQKGRSVIELKMHPQRLFAVAFDVAKWTFPPVAKCGIQRVAGRAFWSKLELEYDEVLAAAKRCLISLEQKFFA